MSLMVTILDKAGNSIVWGQLSEYKFNDRQDLTIVLTKYHCPCQCKDGHTHDGFKIPE